MDGMIQLYARYRETDEKRSMGFRMSPWDKKLLKYGRRFESQMMDLSVHIPLERALDGDGRFWPNASNPKRRGCVQN